MNKDENFDELTDGYYSVEAGSEDYANSETNSEYGYYYADSWDDSS